MCMKDSIANSFTAFNNWKKVSPQKRAHLLMSLSLLLENNKNIYAKLMAQEMGKPISEGRAEIEKCAFVCSYFGQKGPDMLKDMPREGDLKNTFIRYEALGPVLAIMPWNYPFWQVFRIGCTGYYGRQ